MNARLRLAIAAWSAVVSVVLAACTPQAEAPTPTVVAPRVAALSSPFAPLSDQPIPVLAARSAFLTKASRIVMTGSWDATVGRPLLTFSDDSGATWAEGQLTADAERERHPGETPTSLAAVRPGADGGWLVISRSDDVAFAWTSTDGARWERAAMAGFPSFDKASISHMTADEGGFVAVGASEPGPGQPWRPTVWRSPDGRTWSSLVLPGTGVLSSVAARQGVLVAVGGVRFTQRDAAGRAGTRLVVRSTDGGQTWLAVDTPEPIGSFDFMSGFDRVVNGPDGFLAGGTFDRRPDDTYTAMIFASPDGTRWTELVPQPPRQGTATRVVEGMTFAGDRPILALSSQTAKGESATLLYGDPSGWLPAQAPLPMARRSVDATTSLGQVVLAAVSVDDGGPDSQLWRSTDGGRTFSAVSVATPLHEPDVTPSVMVRVPPGLMALGTTQGRIVAWPPAAAGGGTESSAPPSAASSGPSDAFRRPGIVADDRLTDVGGGVSGPSGALVWGSVVAYSSPQAVGWLTADGVRFTAIPAGTFGPVAAYHYSRISGAIWADDRWVVVGERSTNGRSRRSALVYTSPDGVHWAPGQAAFTVRKGDSYSPRSELNDLDGLDGAGRGMSGVAQLGKGLIAVGTEYDGETSLPAVWTAPASTIWSLSRLPTDGLAEAFATNVAVTGKTIVILGHARKLGSTEWIPFRWRSGDGGKSYAGTDVAGGERVRNATLVRAGDRFVVIVSPMSSEGIRMWSSADGVDWRPESPTVPQAAPGTRIRMVSAIGDGDDVTLICRLSDRSDGISTVLRHRIS